VTIRNDILDFSRKQPEWMQDALRRLATQDEITDADLDDLMALLKADNGIPPGGELTASQPLSEAHFRPEPSPSGAISLLELSDVKRVNRLAKDQSLRFAPKGLTIVYGDNGSGKSGYCRLLKKLCRVREGAEETILPNVFERKPGEPAQAVVKFLEAAGAEQTVSWSDGSDPPLDLRQISVFDSRALSLYVDREGKVDYLPYGLDLLPRLAHVLNLLGGRLQEQKVTLARRCEAPLPQVPPSTKVASLLARLLPGAGDVPAETEISDLARFSPVDERQLKKLEESLSGNTGALCELIERAMTTANTILAEISRLNDLLGDDSIARIKEDVFAAREYREAARLAATDAFADEPLAGVGSNPWRLMFEHARAYSAVAYPGEEFPVTRSGSRCVLCQQELDAQAKDRLQRFEAFIREAAEIEAREREAIVSTRLEALRGLSIKDPSLRTQALGGFDGADEKLRKDVEIYLESMIERKTAAIEFLEGTRKHLLVGALPDDPSARLVFAAKHFDERLRNLKSIQEDFASRERLDGQRKELLARKVLSENIALVEKRRTDLLLLERLEACVRACDTTALSRKGTELRRKFVRDAFNKRLLKEIAFFDIGYLPLRITDRTDRGESFIGLTLDMSTRAKLQEILSEGERKAIALATFFAEVEGLPKCSGLIFDDPVSSLDHARRRKVAERIVAAAGSGRQVIVFTHDLVFFNELQVAAAAATPPVPVMTHEVQRTEENGFGTVRENKEPWFVAKVGERLSALEKRLSELRVAAIDGGEDHRRAAVAFYADLRDTWERLVEADLLNGVVTRFTKDVKTQSLKSVVVEDEDYRRIFFAMKKASEWSGHSSPPAGNAGLPTPEEAKKDLNDLKVYLDQIRKRKKKTETIRKSLEKPPKANLR